MSAFTHLATESHSRSIYWGARIDGAYYFDAPTGGDPNIYWATEGASATNVDAPWCATTTDGAWDRFESHMGKTVSLILWGNSGSLANSFDTTAATLCKNRGGINVYTLGCTTQEILDLRDNTNVRSALTQADTLATAMKNWGSPLSMRVWWEMNGNWGYGWQTAQGVSAADYVTAWRTLRGRFDAVGATNVTWVWCPNVKTGTVPDPTPWYPGSAYVDWNGCDGYNHGAETVSTIFDETYTILTGLSSAPILICETGATEGGTPTKAVWIADLAARLKANYPKVRGFMWFNQTFTGIPDCQIETSQASRDAFATAISSRYFRAKIGTTLSFGKVPVP